MVRPSKSIGGAVEETVVEAGGAGIAVVEVVMEGGGAGAGATTEVKVVAEIVGTTSASSSSSTTTFVRLGEG